MQNLVSLCDASNGDFDGLLEMELQTYEQIRWDEDLQGAIRFVQSVGFDSKSSPARNYLLWTSLGGAKPCSGISIPTTPTTLEEYWLSKDHDQ